MTWKMASMKIGKVKKEETSPDTFDRAIELIYSSGPQGTHPGDIRGPGCRARCRSPARGIC